MKQKTMIRLLPLLSILLIIGCSKPQEQGGPPGGMAAIAVIATASGEAVAETIELVGSLEARNAIVVSSEINGTVKELLFEEGSTVKKGDILIRLDDAKPAARNAEAKSRFDLARTNFDRAQALLDSETISQQEFDTVKAEYDMAEATSHLLQEELADTIIKASFDGVVGEKLVSPGQYVTSGQQLTRLVQMDPLEAAFRVPEIYLAKITKGQPVQMDSAAFPNREIKGKVYFIEPFVDQSSRTVLVKAEVDNPDGILKPGVFGTVNLVLSVNEHAVVIPEAAVRYSGDQASVVVRNEQGLADFRNVTVGMRMPDRVEITSGLSSGEQVVVEGYQKIFMPGMPIMISPDSVRYGVEPEAQPETPAE